jgi:sec-independent protein translocase protein TatA
MMGDVAKGIKAFKKGMSDDDTAVTTPTTPVSNEPVRTIEHGTTQPAGTTSTLNRQVG